MEFLLLHNFPGLVCPRKWYKHFMESQVILKFIYYKKKSVFIVFVNPKMEIEVHDMSGKVMEYFAVNVLENLWNCGGKKEY